MEKYYPLRTWLSIALLPLASVTLFACATGSSVRVESNPEGALVSVIASGNAPVSVGKTPLNVEKSSFPGLYSDPVQITVSKEGFESESILIPKSQLETESKLRINLKEVQLNKSCSNQQEALNQVSQGVAAAQRMIYRKEYAEAERLLTQLTTKFTSVSVLYDLLGNVAYLKKDVEKASEYYRKSHDLNPDNPETVRMIKKLTSIRSEGEGRN